MRKNKNLMVLFLFINTYIGMVIILRKNLMLLLLLFLGLFTTSAAPYNKESSYIIMETSSLRVLKGNNIDNQLLVASTAKILTAITVIENYSLSEEIIIKKEYIDEVGSSVYLEENDKITRRDLLYALMLRSANDAASALSDNDSNEFIMLMNETAKKIGMKNSIFTTASGLDEREYNLSTAYDMALLSAYASKNSVFKEIASSHSYHCKTQNKDYFWGNKHKLVKTNETFIWGKTGYTKKAHRILVSNYKDNNMDIIIVTINNSDDWSFHRESVEELDEYTFFTIFEKGIHSITLNKEYYLNIKNDIVIPLKDNEYQNTKIKFKLYTDKAILDIHLDNILIYSTELEVYDEKNLDFDLLINIFNE